jgi:mRNA interferase MazF
MEPFELFITYISWRSGGKNRPVLVLLLNEDTISVFPVTTQYETKSEFIKSQYFKINDWLQAGLDRQSYIDTGILLSFPISAIKDKKPRAFFYFIKHPQFCL